MGATKKHLLYVCADRGIPFNGIKGSSIHMREFLGTLLPTEYSPTVLVAKSYEDTLANLPFPVHSLKNDMSPVLFHETAVQHGAIREALREIEDFNRNQIVLDKLSQIHVERKVDLIYERYSIFSMAGLVFAKQMKIPFVLEINAPLVREASQYRNLHNTELAKMVEKYLFMNADHIVTVSTPLKDYVLSIAPEAEVTAIPNGVDLARFNGQVSAGDWRRKITAAPDDDFVLCFVGSVKPWHGVELLIEALGDLVNSDRSFSLCIVGNADQVKSDIKLRAKALGLKHRLTILGAVPYQDIPAIMSSADVLVAPYPDLPDFYFSPLKIFEYMASGKPIVASRIGQLCEILSDGVTALLTTPGNRQELTEALLHLKSDANLRSKLGQQALAVAQSRHGWDQRIATATGIFDSLLSARINPKDASHANQI